MAKSSTILFILLFSILFGLEKIVSKQQDLLYAVFVSVILLQSFGGRPAFERNSQLVESRPC